jgi:hypothetical protein
VASVEYDLRASDAYIVSVTGPYVVDFGVPVPDRDSSSSESSYDDDLLNVIDGFKVTKVFDSMARAVSWQDAVEQRSRAELNLLRAAFDVSFPNRHRRV